MLHRRLARSLALTATLAFALAACSGSGVEQPETPAPSGSGSPTESAAPAVSVDPDSAEGRLPAFAAALEDSWSQEQPVDRRRTIDALVDAGFGIETLEATDEIDAVGGRVHNIEVAARIGEDCLLGQTGQDGTRASVMPALPSGVCLVGDTPPVD